MRVHIPHVQEKSVQAELDTRTKANSEDIRVPGLGDLGGLGRDEGRKDTDVHGLTANPPQRGIWQGGWQQEFLHSSDVKDRPSKPLERRGCALWSLLEPVLPLWPTVHWPQ